MKIGIDLGTSNTVVSTFTNGKIQPLKKFQMYSSSEMSAIIPSIQLEYQDNSSSLSAIIGGSGKHYCGYNAIETFIDYYENEPEKLKNSIIHAEYKRQIGNSLDSSHSTTKMIDFIISNIHKSQEITGNVIEGLVVTVPHEWSPESEARNATREAVDKNKFGVPLIRLVSEPIAASAYYAYIRKEKVKEVIIICDIGGGTQDYTLCKIYTDNSIQILDNDGSNETGGSIIDDQIVEQLLSKTQAQDIDQYDRLYLKLQSEKLKVKLNRKVLQEVDDSSSGIFNRIWRNIKQATKDLFSHVSEYFNHFREEKINFKDEQISFSPSRIPALTKDLSNKAVEHISNLLSRNPQIKIDKIVLVGGCSNNILFQSHLREKFDFDFVSFDSEDMYMAISYGASLIANGIIKVEERTRVNYGIMVKMNNETKPIPILPINTKYGERVLSEYLLKPTGIGVSKTSVVIWKDEGNFSIVGESFALNQFREEVKFAMYIDENDILIVECLDKNDKILEKKEYHKVL